MAKGNTENWLFAVALVIGIVEVIILSLVLAPILESAGKVVAGVVAFIGLAASLVGTVYCAKQSKKYPAPTFGFWEEPLSRKFKRYGWGFLATICFWPLFFLGWFIWTQIF